MATATMRVMMTAAQAALRVGVIEYHVREAIRAAPYKIVVGRYYFVCEQDLDLLRADLRRAGHLADEPAPAE